MKIGKNSVLSEKDQKSILRKVSNFDVSVYRFRWKDGVNSIKTAVDVLF